ncbi:hypothetical protein M514_20659 [Trichuris suis]|uniref:Uncharacterized protein n=1 Tax=Trichuris suis TaxID=68888 RepID=A0A085NCM7_9BILA|nr:hypothetical protein M514_22230 [Trichuris suis]KFD67223.1 hypothetical protein M514_20659 [Trichuris suis]
MSSLWRNRLARSAVNRKVGGSSPPRDDCHLQKAPVDECKCKFSCPYGLAGRLPCKRNDLEDSRSNACSFENYRKQLERYGQSMLVTKASSKLTTLLCRGGDEIPVFGLRAKLGSVVV